MGPWARGPQPWLTVVGGDQFTHAVVWLAALHQLLSVVSACGKLVGPVHPIHPSIDMVLVASSNLQDARHPIVVRSLPRSLLVGHGFLALDGGVVRNVDEALA